MPAYSTVKRVVLQTEDPTERKIRFMALLTSSLPKQPRGPILVGGSAIEVYLDGMLRTGDMDVVYDMKALGGALRAWKFELRGLRAWTNEELGLAVDMVGGDYTGSLDMTTTITTDYGPVRVAGVEDLILRRLASAKHWRVPADMEQAYLLAKAHHDRVDWGYMSRKAEDDLTSDYLGKLRRALKKGPPPARGRKIAVRPPKP